MSYRRRKRRKLKKGPKIIAVILVILLILMSGLFLFAGSILNRMEKTDTMSRTEADIAEEVMEQVSNYQVFNFLLFGADSNDFEDEKVAMERADATKIISLDMNRKTISIASLQRDTMVWIPEPVNDWSKLNHAYWWGGADLAIRTINMNFDMNITKYVTFSMTGVEKVVDAVGGVDIYLDEAESEYFNNGFIKETGCVPGVYHLNGREAMNYARLREIDNDYNRMNRQNIVIKAIISKMADCTLTQMLSVVTSVMPYIETNFTNLEIETWLARIISYDLGNIRTQDVPKGDGEELWAAIEYNGYTPCYILKDYQKVIVDLYGFLYPGLYNYRISMQALEIQSELYRKFADELQ